MCQACNMRCCAYDGFEGCGCASCIPACSFELDDDPFFGGDEDEQFDDDGGEA